MLDASTRVGGGEAKRFSICVRGLELHFPIREGVFQRTTGYARAVDGVSFDLCKGQTLGIVGESGSGKSTMARCIAGLIVPTGGGVYYDMGPVERDRLDLLIGKGDARSPSEVAEFVALQKSHRIDRLSRGLWKKYRLNCQMVFQDSLASLNPRQLVHDIIGRPLRVHQHLRGGALTRSISKLMDEVGLDAGLLYRYPHQLSGGQRQRVSIARALAPEPEMLILDEPTSNLDVSVQAQILNLLHRLQQERNLTYIFISHDLSVIRHMSDWISVMYAGDFCEIGPARALFTDPRHPYTKALLEAVDIVQEGKQLRLEGEVPDPVRPPSGCRFHPRCPMVTPACGWEIRDIVDWMRLAAEEVFEGLVEVKEHSEFSGTLVFRSAESAELCVRALESAGPPAVLSEAVREVAREDCRVRVDLRAVDRIKLEDAWGERSSSCILFTGGGTAGGF